MSIWMELRCDRRKEDGKCHSDQNIGPSGYSRTEIRKHGKEKGWRFGKDDQATCPGCIS